MTSGSGIGERRSRPPDQAWTTIGSYSARAVFAGNAVSALLGSAHELAMRRASAAIASRASGAGVNAVPMGSCTLRWLMTAPVK